MALRPTGPPPPAEPDKLTEVELLELVRAQPLPAHVAVIMDGNGRWATRRGFPRVAGHREGVKAARAIVRAADTLGLRYLTLYAFSTENWSRPEDEVSTLMSLLERSIHGELPGTACPRPSVAASTMSCGRHGTTRASRSSWRSTMAAGTS